MDLSNRVEPSKAEPITIPKNNRESQILWTWTTLRTGLGLLATFRCSPRAILSYLAYGEDSSFSQRDWRRQFLHRNYSSKAAGTAAPVAFLHHTAHAKPDLALCTAANVAYGIKSYWGFLENTLLWKQFCLYIIHFPVILIPWVFYYWGVFAWK